MSKETIEEFLARGGIIQRDDDETTLEKLLYNEGLFNHEDARRVKSKLLSSIEKTLSVNPK